MAEETQRYQGSCQCGAVQFSAELNMANLVRCNCSRCRRMGFVLSAVPADRFELVAGEGVLKEFRFNTRTIAHLFCPDCGVEPFARGTDRSGTETVMVNVNCIPDAEYDLASVQMFDGRSY